MQISIYFCDLIFAYQIAVQKDINDESIIHLIQNNQLFHQNGKSLDHLAKKVCNIRMKLLQFHKYKRYSSDYPVSDQIRVWHEKEIPILYIYISKKHFEFCIRIPFQFRSIHKISVESVFTFHVKQSVNIVFPEAIIQVLDMHIHRIKKFESQQLTINIGTKQI